jgi:predicted alpha/beta-fold hydrolase
LLGDNDNDHESTRRFLVDLNLATVHPFCIGNSFASFGNDTSIPPMGTLDFLEEIQIADGSGGGYSLEALLTLWYWLAPALLAMGELWLRLFSGLLGPIGITYLLYSNANTNAIDNKTKTKKPTATRKTSLVIMLTVSSSLILMTDTLYVLQNGSRYGFLLFVASVVLSFRLCWTHNLKATSLILAALVLLSAHLVTKNENGSSIHFGDPVDDVDLAEGLYYDSGNSLVSSIAKRWPETFRVYDKDHGATTWMPTGDSRTGLPFIIHKYRPHEYPIWTRVFLEVQDEKDPVSEYIALDISFPKKTGHDPTKPIYFVLHGLHGGSMEEYIRDLTIRRNNENSTVVVMIARGLMDTPIRGWNIFHGARTSDAQAAASVIKHRALADGQVLVGVGYSMGAIIIANYVASYGKHCALDAAVAVSGGLDMRYQERFYRAQRLWQPMLAGTLRDKFLLGKFGHRVKEKLTSSEYLKILRATHITVRTLEKAAVGSIKNHSFAIHARRG